MLYTAFIIQAIVILSLVVHIIKTRANILALLDTICLSRDSTNILLKNMNQVDGALVDRLLKVEVKVNAITSVIGNNVPTPFIKPLPTITKVSEEENFGEIIDENPNNK